MERRVDCMKIRDILNKDTATISFEVFPPKKSTDFGNVEAAALGIAALQPAYMSVTYGAGGSTKGHTIALAGDIQKQYNVPTVAHLTCVCADRSSIGAALTEMQAAGIENILALRGDTPEGFRRRSIYGFYPCIRSGAFYQRKRRFLRGWCLLSGDASRFCE